MRVLFVFDFILCRHQMVPSEMSQAASISAAEDHPRDTDDDKQAVETLRTQKAKLEALAAGKRQAVMAAAAKRKAEAAEQHRIALGRCRDKIAEDLLMEMVQGDVRNLCVTCVEIDQHRLEQLERFEK